MCSTVLAPLIVNMTGEHAYASKPTSDFFWPSASAWTYAFIKLVEMDFM